MKKIITSAAFFAALFLFAGNTSAQNSAYWEAEANKAIAKADRAINYYNKQLNVFSPQEMQMMRNNDPRFIQIANKKTQRLDAAQRQYEAHYNKQWVRSFNTFNTPRYVRDQYGNVYRAH
jgi:hypothetical protein